ncbi:uncharacterized protein LOC142339676 [Convolutriloba macropyga]|uniref:uncharacterized protein LOC142339676 n=1 Tax=Convolutriloba macropyga TaxID=536237 RepID=UPI003F520BDA
MSCDALTLVPKHSIEDVVHSVFDEVKQGLVSRFGLYKEILSGEIRNVVDSRTLKSSLIGNENLTVAEFYYKIKVIDIGADDKEEFVTILSFIETNSTERIGNIRIKNELPCSLHDIFYQYLLPDPRLTDSWVGEITFSNYENLIPISLLPGISKLHRRGHFAYDQEFLQRSRFLWHSEFSSKERKSIKSFETRVSKKTALKKRHDLETHFCQILGVMLEEKENSQSFLALLSTEVLETIYSHVVNYWKSCIETRGIFASIVARVKFPEPTGTQHALDMLLLVAWNILCMVRLV